jgi:UDP-N-acetylglucosamine 2-epimerase (non-hydrolysing)
MRQCIFVIGTRAQLVKLAPVLNLASQSALQHVVWFTGQHNESIEDLIDDFDIQSEFIRPGRQTERSSIFRLLTWLPGTLLACFCFVRGVRDRTQSTPLVVVHGDTLSTYLGAVAGRLARSRIVHLESGLSSGSLADPFPEEMLRRLTFRLTNFALCPNDDACDRMRTFDNCEVVHTGENTLLDSVRGAVEYDKAAGHADTSAYFVVSIHRFQNLYKRSTLQRIVAEVIGLSSIGPVHFILHPPTELRLKKYGLLEQLNAAPAVMLRSRMPYTEFLALIAIARGVVSDGGSNQEELSYLGVPTILFRDRSERPDGIGGNVVLYTAAMSPLTEFVLSGRLDALRKPMKIDADVQPSQISVDAIAGWAAN